MSNISIKSFREDANQLYQSYDFNFAGRPRATRDLELLDSIISQLEELIQTATANEQIRNTPSFVDVLQTATDNLVLYKEERSRIETEKERPNAVEKANLDSKAARLSSIYGRKFAGQNRATRDVRLLEELVDQTDFVREGYEKLVEGGDSSADLAESISGLKESLDMYRSEIDKIREAQQGITAPDERVSLLATLANDQFHIYSAQFVGKSRVTRRPALLSRVIDSLEDIRHEMRAIQESPSVTSPTNTNNINIVTGNLELYQNELSQIRSARASISPAELANELATAANNLMAEYGEHFAGQMRATRDVQKLSDLCDGMWEVAQQMEDLLDNTVLEYNAENLRKVEENWTSYEREFFAVKEAVEGNNA